MVLKTVVRDATPQELKDARERQEKKNPTPVEKPKE